MPSRLIPPLKALVHLACWWPFLWLLEQYRNGFLAANADPVNFITHFTGDWTLWILLAGLAITPLRRLSPRLAWLVRFRRMIGLYAFFYATLHMSTYIFLFSGYDLPGAVQAAKQGHPRAIVDQWKAVWPTMRDDALKRRFIQVGLLGWTILLALAATSPRRVLMAMGGKNWQRLHRLVYVAAIAGVIHYMWLVKTGVRAPWKDAAVLAALLLARAARWIWKRNATSASRKAPTQARQIQDVSG